MVQPPPLPPAPERMPPRAWPVWLAFALLLVPGMLMLSVLGGEKDTRAERLAFDEDARGRSFVLTGTLADVETNAGLPTNTGLYAVTIPDAEGGRGETVTLAGDQHWGFPPSPDHPAELDFLVVLDDPPRAVAHGPVGSVSAVTDSSVDAAQRDLDVSRTLWIAAVVVFWVLFLGLPALAVAFTVRRRRARAAIPPPPLI